MYRKLANFDFLCVNGGTFERKSFEFQILGNAILAIPEYTCHQHFIREKR